MQTLDDLMGKETKKWRCW